ncbi:MAG: type IV toxin-antitoxin system AbiEi family antitoxin domain-containing protein [Actinobacteria bacterium]|nr:type IV toxin-antitoxin system AbiEi family antitoxin domain-containing protein [Actinomycetota bacterium]
MRPPALEPSLERILSDVATNQLGVFSRRQAKECGISDGVISHAVKAGRVERIYRGTYRMTTSPSSWQQSLIAACLSPGEGTFASHRAAARLWAMEGMNETVLEISTTRDVRQMSGVVVHRVTSWPHATSSVASSLLPSLNGPCWILLRPFPRTDSRWRSMMLCDGVSPQCESCGGV